MRILLFFLYFLNTAFASSLIPLGSVISPNGELTFTVLQNELGELKYTVQQQDTLLIAPFTLGLERSDQSFQ